MTPSPAPIRPMDATLDGYAWLPRLIDKARAARAGTLGDRVHPCPVDRRALKMMGISFADFSAVIARTGTDAEVVAQLQELGARPAGEAWFDALAWEDALQEMAWLSEGEVVSDRAERTVAILRTTPELTVTWSRYVSGERGPDLHVHREHTDAFFVLTGSMRYELGPDGERVVDAPAGTLVVVPPLVGHAFHNAQADEVTWLNFHAPDADFARFLRTGEDFDSFDLPLEDGARGAGADLAVTVSGAAFAFAGAGLRFSTDGFRADVAAGGSSMSYCVV